jgi:hypothetical protein
MLTRLVSAMVVLGCAAGIGWPQDAARNVSLGNPPFEGEVVADHLNVRIFPKVDAGSTILTIVPRGTKVKVLEEKDGWYGLVPPAQAWVWVWGRNLKVGKDGATCIRECSMRADSRANAPALGKMETGTTVKLLKEHLGWFKVTAPDTMRVWASAKFIKFIRPIEGEAPPATAGAKPSARPAAGADAAAYAKLDEARKLVDLQLSLLGQKKVAELDYSGIVALAKEAARVAATDAVRKDAEDMARTYQKMQDHLVAVRAAGHTLGIKLAEIERKVRELNAKPPRKEFAFTGKLEVTGALLRDRPGTHKLVADDGRIICFLKAKDGDQQMVWAMNGFYQKQAGVNGTIVNDPWGWTGYSVVIVDEICPIITEEEKKQEEMREDGGY